MIIALDNHIAVGLCADEAKRPGAYRIPRHFLAAARRHDPDRAVRQIPEQGCILLSHVEDNRAIVRRIDMIHEPVYRGLGAANLPLKQRIERPFHIARGQRSPVMKLNPTMKMEDVGERIRNLPALRQSRRHIQILSARQQIVEDQVINPFRLRVDSHPRVKIRGTRLNNHDQRIGIRLCRTGQRREHRDKQR